MTPLFLITGGTGTLGRRVLPLLEGAGHLRVLTRRPPPATLTGVENMTGDRAALTGVKHVPGDPSGLAGVEYVAGDLATGAGVEQAARDVTTVLHLAGGSSGDVDKARILVRALAPGTHVVFISVVGADRVPVVSRVDRAMFGYFADQLAAERVIAESGLPWTTLRATQFHDLTLLVARQMTKLPVIPVPAGVRFQPLDAGLVATRLVELALGAPAGLVEDLAGPRVEGMDALLRAYLKKTGQRRLLVPMRLGGRAYAAIRAGANLAASPGTGLTWDGFLGAATALPGDKP
ncbi:SDR family oxidoreductase [Winogradskya consettensis]|nr:SDR family oxidoreductase [Actinoplanes consettensis]